MLDLSVIKVISTCEGNLVIGVTRFPPECSGGVISATFFIYWLSISKLKRSYIMLGLILHPLQMLSVSEEKKTA